MASETTSDQIDESQVSGDNGEVYLFQWLASTEKKIRHGNPEFMKSSQSALEATLVKVITSPEPYPSPGRALRNPTARCLVSLYTRGETRTLFDTLQSFMKIVGDFKTPDKDMNKIAAFYCIGELMAVFGAQFMSFMAEIATISVKTYKSSNSAILRHNALLALRKALSTSKRAVTDAVSKDILKQMRSGLSDKSLPIQRAAADVLIVMYSSLEINLPINDVEAVVTICTKSLENADQATRHALSQLVGHMLASTQSERIITVAEAPQKGKNQAENETDVPVPSHVLGESKKTMLTPGDMLALLSTQFNKVNVSRKVRIGLFDFYAALLTKLGLSFVENQYALIVGHLMNEIVSHLRNSTTRYETLLVRSLVGILLRDLIGVRMLSEQGQIGAIQDLSNSYLKRWPAMMPGQVSPSPLVLAIVLKEVAGLLQQLGNAPPPVQDAVSEPLVTLLAHPNHTVRVSASWALRCFCYSTPLRLPRIILAVMEMLQRDLASLLSPAAPSDVNLRALGHAYGLAALVAVIPQRPLYVSYDVSAKVLDMATQLLKRAGEHDIKVASVEVEVAWTSIASLMSLGPNFVRPHLPQLLVLWRNALPKPTSKDTNANGSGRSAAEWSFLLHLRDSALGAILCFLRHNTSLVTLDVARRIASLLTNALSFANTFISQYIEDPLDPATFIMTDSNGLPLRSREALLRRRVYQCFTALGFSSITESTQATLLQSVVSLFASPDGYVGSSTQAAITSSAGTFTSVWQSVDGYAYGVTFLEVMEQASADEDHSSGRNQLNRDTIEMGIDALLRKPVLGACEHDPLALCPDRFSGAEFQLLESPPPATSVVDAAIDLFAQLLPLQDLTSTSRIITQLVDSVRSVKLEKNTGRKSAVSINAAVALVLALRQATASHFRHARETLGNSQVTATLAPFLKDILIDGDMILRSASSEAIGRLASLAGTTFLAGQMKTLVDHILNNRDPYGRAGCALALGSVYSHVGGLAAGPLLKTTVQVLMSLASDPHPVVYFWVLTALARVINAASLAYAPFVSSTLGMLLKVYSMDTHEVEGGTLANANLGGDFPAYPVLCEIIDAVITILGPDIQESARTRTLVLNLVHEFSQEEDESICVEAIKCMQHFLMFAPEHVQIPELVDDFRGHLSSSRQPLKLASINALYQLVQKDALSMSKLGGDRLVEDLFGMLDADSSVEGVRNVITSWLQQTAVHNPSAWIDLCQRIMSHTTASQQVADAASKPGIVRDDEGESLSVGLAKEGSGAGSSHLTSRWRTQLFALQCLHDICTIVGRSNRREHLDIPFAKSQGLPSSGLLVSRVPDLIKMAFTASTAYVTEIRLEGLIVLRDVIQIFAAAPDPDYEDSLLLEQHQAPITAALTPAFSADSTPEILASAVHAGAIFVGCGVVKDMNRMGRILKLLTTALDQSKESGMLTLGEAAELSPNASAMLRISTLSAWAQLQIASGRQNYLANVVKPHRMTLSSLWIASLRDYASIRADTESIGDTSSVALDSSYSSLGKEVLLPYYVKSWPVILEAVALTMAAGDPSILAAMDGRETMTAAKINGTVPVRDEPTVFFFVIFGLVYEALASSSAEATSVTSRQPTIIAALQALKSLVKPEYAGKALLEPTTFDEFISLCYRMAMTETATIQVHLIEVLAALASNQDQRSKAAGNLSDNNFSPTSAQTHCLRICAHVLRHSVSSSRGPIIQGETQDRIKMIMSAFSAFTTVACFTQSNRREDVRSVAILLYSELLKDESSELDLVGPTLTALKGLLDIPVYNTPDAKNKFGRLVHGLLSACLLHVDEMRGRQGLISSKKIKNNLLASVLILTVIPPFVKVGRGVIEQSYFLISQKLLALDETSLTAAHCAKTLMATSSSGNMMLRECAKFLLPALIEYVAKMAPLVDDGSASEQHLAAIGEVWKAFTALFTSTPESQRTRILGVLLPTIILLLRPSDAPATPIHAQSVSQLLTFAATSPTSFKEATGKLEPAARELMEQSVRKALGSSTSVGGASNAPKPQISLRSF